MKTYRWDDLRELYRVDNKYWKTGDVDILDKRMALGKKIDERFWDCITSLTEFVTKQHKPFNVLVEAMKVLGYEAEEQMRGEEDDRTMPL